MKQNEEEMSDQIVVMEKVSRDVSRIASVGEAKEYRDRAAALSAYARSAGESLELVNQCQEVRLRMERRAGELLDLEIPHGGDRVSRSRAATLLLSDLGISKSQSFRWRRIASIPEPIFEAFLDKAKTEEQEITLAAALNLHREHTRAQKRREIESVEVSRQIDSGKLIMGRMENELPKLEPASVDLIITDPPYGLGSTADIEFLQRENMSKPAGSWDEEITEAHIQQWSEVFAGVMTPEGSLYVFTCDFFIGTWWDALLGAGFTVRDVLVWVKTNPAPSVRKRTLVSSVEYIIFATAGDRYTVNWLGHSSMMKHIIHPICGGAERLDHPTQKPVGVLKRFIEISSNPSDLVLDPFAGVGSTGAAARELGRQYILVEAHGYYFKQAYTRLS